MTTTPQVAFDSSGFIDIVRPYIAKAPDALIVDMLRQAAIDVAAALDIWRNEAKPSGDNDGKWVGNHNGYDFSRALYMKASKTGDKFPFELPPEIKPLTNPDRVEFYTPRFNEKSTGGGLAKHNYVPAGEDAAGLVLVYSIKPKANAAGVNRDFFDLYKEHLRYKALILLAPFLDENLRHTNYEIKFAGLMFEAQNAHSPNVNGVGPARRGGLAPPYAGSGYVGSGRYSL